MSMMSDADRQTLQQTFAELTTPVTLRFYTQTIGCETCLPARQVLDELVGASDKVTLEEVNLVLDRDRAARDNVDRPPAVLVVGVGDGRMRFLGAPLGYEFASLVDAVRLAGGADSQPLGADSLERLATVTTPVAVQVFVTPG